MDDHLVIDECEGFEWDAGNVEKNWLKQDSSEHIDWSKAKITTFSKLKPSTSFKKQDHT